MKYLNSYFHPKLIALKPVFGFFLLLLAAAHGTAQGILPPVGARYLALGTYSAKYVDVYATRNNPASLAQLKRASVGVYAERRFLQENLNQYTASLGLPAAGGAFALHGSYLGFSLQNQTQLQLAYGLKLGSKVDIGAAFDYRSIRQSGIYGNSNAITGSVGMMLHLTEKIHAGVYAYNPLRAAWSKTNQEERLPSRYTFGLGYDASDKFFVSAELEQEEGQGVNINAGFQYQFVPQFFVRAGVGTLTSNYFVGLGFRLKDVRLDLATSYHPQLGLTPGLLLVLDFGKKAQTPPDEK